MPEYEFTVLALFFTCSLALCRLFYIWFRHIGPPDYFKLSGVPSPKPLPNFDIDYARPRPYRPFRWEYHQNMALKKMEPDWWLELESTYRDRVAQRQELYAQLGKAILDELPGSKEASKELMEMVIQFLCARYPKQFRVDWRSGVFHNSILGTSSNIKTVNPLHFLLDHVPEDFLIVQQDKTTGLYYLRAAVSCSAVGWRLREKMGKPLHAIHASVPDYKQTIELSMNRYFSKLACDKPVQRGSWELAIGQPLYSQPGDGHFELRDTQRPDLDIEDIHLRVDWQTLRRLPVSRAIVFNFKALFTPVTDFRNEPYIPKLLAKILRKGKPSLLHYKATHHVEHKVLPVLDLWAEEQENKGLVPEGWEVRTLDEEPYFPGWDKSLR